MLYLGNLSDNNSYNYSQKLTSESLLLFSSGVWIFRTISHQQPHGTIPDTLLPRKSTINNHSYDFPTHETILSPIYDFNSRLYKKV